MSFSVATYAFTNYVPRFLFSFFLFFFIGQTPKSDISPNIAPKSVTPENYLEICDSSTTLIGQLAIVTLFGAILSGIPLSGPHPFFIILKTFLLPSIFIDDMYRCYFWLFF